MSDTTRTSPLIKALEGWGAIWLSTFAIIGGVWYLIRDVATWLGRAIFQRRVRLGRDPSSFVALAAVVRKGRACAVAPDSPRAALRP